MVNILKGIFRLFRLLFSLLFFMREINIPVKRTVLTPQRHIRLAASLESRL